MTRYVETIERMGANLKIGMSLRDFCPACGGKNTFSITRKFSGLAWFCFKADCRFKGLLGKELTKDELRSNISFVESEQKEFDIPHGFLHANASAGTMNLLRQYDIEDVYENHRVDVRFDIKTRRHMFMVHHQGKCYGGVGRSYIDKPKWLFVGEAKLPLIVPKHGAAGRPYYLANTPKIGVVVEDAISAAKVSFLHDGVAILGTHISPLYMLYLLSYDRLYIALDEDATGKAIKYQQHINWYVPTKVVQLRKDIKDMPKEAIRNLFLENA